MTESWAKEFKDAAKRLMSVLAARARQHATFFEAEKKQNKEIYIVNKFFGLHEEVLGQHLVNLHLGADPPDVIVETSSQEQWAFEVSEIVNQKAIEAQINRSPEYASLLAEWRHHVLDQIKERIRRKNELLEKCQQDFDRIVLLLHTDEPKPRSDELEQMIRAEAWSKPSSFDYVFLLAGPTDQSCSCRVVAIC